MKGCLLISVTYLPEIIYIYICFPRFSQEILPISTGTLSKLEICALSPGNFSGFFKNEHVENVFNFLLWWRLYSFYITWSFLYIPVKISMIYMFFVWLFCTEKQKYEINFASFQKYEKIFFISFFNTINSGLKNGKIVHKNNACVKSRNYRSLNAFVLLKNAIEPLSNKKLYI